MLNLQEGPGDAQPRGLRPIRRLYQHEIKRLIEVAGEPRICAKKRLKTCLSSKRPTGRAAGIVVRGGAEYRGSSRRRHDRECFCEPLMHTGEAQTPGGRAGEGTTAGIGGALGKLGIELRRFKTGTPPAIERPHDRLLACEVAAG